MLRMKGLRGKVSAWQAPLTGLVVTSFAFLGVRMSRSGLPSYETLQPRRVQAIDAQSPAATGAAGATGATTTLSGMSSVSTP
jgi:hypothetical protein